MAARRHACARGAPTIHYNAGTLDARSSFPPAHTPGFVAACVAVVCMCVCAREHASVRACVHACARVRIQSPHSPASVAP